MRPEIAQEAIQEAARWHARLQADDCSEDDLQAFQRWQQQDSAHGEAAALGRDVLARFDRAGMDARLQALAQEAFASYASVDSARRRRWTLPLSLAASVAVFALALSLLIRTSDPAETVAYQTANAERRVVTLADGSSIEMDIGTRVEVRLSSVRRDIELKSGRAVFDVAHDAQRPFSVTAGQSRTTALGTRFQVQEQDGRVIVTLQEGSVLVQSDTAPDRAVPWQERLTPGEQLNIDERNVTRSRRSIDPVMVTSWTHGRHVFRATPLDEVVAEVNRYASTKIRLADPALAGLAVGGNFIAGDSEQIVAALAALLPVRVVRGGDDEIILFTDDPTDADR